MMNSKCQLDTYDLFLQNSKARMYRDQPPRRLSSPPGWINPSLMPRLKNLRQMNWTGKLATWKYISITLPPSVGYAAHHLQSLWLCMVWHTSSLSSCSPIVSVYLPFKQRIRTDKSSGTDAVANHGNEVNGFYLGLYGTSFSNNRRSWIMGKFLGSWLRTWVGLTQRLKARLASWISLNSPN